MNTEHLNKLLEKTSHYDKDERYMATTDLCNEFSKGIRIDDSMEARICAAIVKQLDDKSNDVQSVAVKCLGVLIKKVQAPRVADIGQKLSDLILKGDDELRDIYSIGLKTLINDTPEEIGPSIVGILPRQLLEGINRSPNEGVRRECLENLTDLIKRFGGVFAKDRGDILEAVLGQLHVGSPAVKKRASVCLGAFSVTCNDGLFSQLVEALLSRVTAVDSDKPSLIQTIGTVSRTVGYRMGRYIEQLLPLFISFCGDPEQQEEEDPKLNELREYSFPGLESFVIFCPREVDSHITQLLDLAVGFMKYDPNYDADADDFDGMDVDDGDDYGADDYGGGSDDDDSSWKVRKAAVKLMAAIISSHSEMLKYIYDEYADNLIQRFKEREENVRLDIIAAFTSMVVSTATGATASEDFLTTFDKKPTSPRRPALKRMNSLEVKLDDKVPAIVAASLQQLRARGAPSIKTKSAIFQLLRCTASTLKGGLSNFLDDLLAESLKALRDSNQTLKLDVLNFLRVVLETHAVDLTPSQTRLVMDPIFRAANEDWYKIIAEALRVVGALIGVIRPVSSTSIKAGDSDLAERAGQIYSAVIHRLEALDIDQEIKDCAITVSGKLLAHLGDLLGPDRVNSVLTVLRKRLENEVTRISALRALMHASKSPLAIDLSSVLPAVLGDMAGFLKQQSRTLKQTTLMALTTILDSDASRGAATTSLVDPILRELSSLINDTDLNLAQQALKASISIFERVENSATGIRSSLYPRAIQLSLSPLLQGTCQQALIQFFSVLVQRHAPGMDFSETITELRQQPLAGLTRQSITNIAKCMAGICTECDTSSRNAVVEEFARDISGGSPEKRHLALIGIGEIGQRFDIAGTFDLKDLILSCFGSDQEEIKLAAAYALGHVAVGNKEVYLPIVLSAVDASQQHAHQYFLLVALKEFILICANNDLDISSFVGALLPGLFSHCRSDEDSVRSMVAECIGAILIMNGEQVIDGLLAVACENIDDKFSRRTVTTALKHFLSRQNRKSGSSSEVMVHITRINQIPYVFVF